MSASMSANTTDAEVGRPKIAERVFRCLLFTRLCYQSMIAVVDCSALVGLILVTRNPKDFASIEGLELRNPWQWD